MLPSCPKMRIISAAVQASKLIKERRVPLQLTPTTKRTNVPDMSNPGQWTDRSSASTQDVQVDSISKVFFFIFQMRTEPKIQATRQLGRV